MGDDDAQNNITTIGITSANHDECWRLGSNGTTAISITAHVSGGSVLAMAGKDCIAIAVDKRFGNGPALVQVSAPPLWLVTPTIWVASTGLQSDVQSLQQELSALLTTTRMRRSLGFASRRYKYHHHHQQQQHRVNVTATATTATTTSTNITNTSNTKSMNDDTMPPTITIPLQDSNLSPPAVASLLSHILYRRKQAPYYVEPIVVGFEPISSSSSSPSSSLEVNTTSASATTSSVPIVTTTTEKSSLPPIQYRPYLCSFDMIGAKSLSHSFVCAGVAASSLYGTAQAHWVEDLSPLQLLRVCTTAFQSAMERDCFSGYGILVYLITPTQGIVEYDMDTRND